MFCLRKLLSLLAEKRLNRRREETCMKPVRASFRTGKSPFSTPEEPLPDSKQGSYRPLNMALTRQKQRTYIKSHFSSVFFSTFSPSFRMRAL